MKDTVLIDYPHPEMARVVINRPEAGNSYNDEVICTLITAFDEFAQDGDLKLIWITSAGEHFMNGPDPSWIQLRKKSGKAEHQHDAEQLSRLFDTLYQLPIPILASVRGNANAAGVGLLCCCDLVVASDCSSYTISETKFGQVPALQSPYLVKALGERSARYYSLTGETMDATTAARVGLVSKVVAADEFEEIVESTVQRLLRRTNLILRQTKAMLNLSANEILDDSLVDTLVECSTDIRLSQNHDSRKVLP